MATLSGHRVSPSLNYYDADAISVDLSTIGFAAGTTWSFSMKATTTDCAEQLGYDVYLQRPLPSTETCFHWSAITPGGNPLQLMSYGPSSVGSGIEWSGTAGATGCVDFTRITFRIISFHYPGHCAAEWDWSVTYTPATSAAICAYGTEMKPTDTTVLIVTAGLVVSLAAAGLIAPWAIGVLGGAIGAAIGLNSLCSSPKPTDQIIAESDWTTPNPSGPGSLAHAKTLSNFRNVLWDTYCRCTPAPSGSPAPVSPPATTITTPTYLNVTENIQIDNTEISTTINALWQYFLTVNIGSNNNLSLGQETKTCTCTDFKLGTAHEGLSGLGTFVVSGIHGLSVIFTTLPDRTGVDIGDPDKIYDVGWINVGNDWGWQAPMYMDTTKWIVFPPDMHQMTRVGYSIPEDVVVTIAELVQA